MRLLVLTVTLLLVSASISNATSLPPIWTKDGSNPYSQEEIAAFNKIVAGRISSLAVWFHPVSVSLMYIDNLYMGDSIYPLESIKLDSEPFAYSNAVVTIERYWDESMADDSVAGERYIVTLEKQPDDIWFVGSVSQSEICHKGRSRKVGSEEKCS